LRKNFEAGRPRWTFSEEYLNLVDNYSKCCIFTTALLTGREIMKRTERC
jgi:hypothetical protein